MVKTLKLYKRIAHEGKKYAPIFMLLSCINLIIVPLDFYGLLLSRDLVDKGLLLHDWETIKGILYILVGLFLVRSLISYGTEIFVKKVQLQINQEFQNRIFFHMLHLPMGYLVKEKIGRLMSRVLDDGARYSKVLSLIFGSVALNPLKLVALLVFLTYINLNLCLIMLSSAILTIILIYCVGNMHSKVSKHIQVHNAAIFSHVEQVFPNIELIKSKNAEKMTVRGFFQLVENLIEESLRLLKISLFTQPILQILKYFTIGCIFIYGGWLISKNSLTMGTLSIFMGGAYLFFNTISDFGLMHGRFRENCARLEAIYDIFDTPCEELKSDGHFEKIQSIKSIEFKDVTFAYHISKPVLKSVSFKINKGEVLGISGQSGSGKTTLMRLLVGFFKPDSGEILINGKPLEYYDLVSLRTSTGIAFQENFLLNGSIKSNITFGKVGIGLEDVIHASKTACIHELVNKLPDGYDSVIGEGGKNLSGGEKQRIAIARAIITDPLILILDEATSFLEIEKEATILESIKRMRKDKITLIISHRLSALEASDKIILLDQGRIIERK